MDLTHKTLLYVPDQVRIYTMSKRAISKSNSSSRLFTKDEHYLKNKVKTLKFTDPNFRDNSSAIRYYVQIGIASERRVEAANSLDDKIIKSSQQEVVREELNPLKKSIDSLINVIERMNDNQNKNTQEVLKSQELTNLKLDSINDQLSQHLLPLLKLITKSEFLNMQSLRNIIILRSVLFVFLMAHRTERINPDKIKDWQKIIKFAHVKAEELTDEELKHIESNTFETSIVEDLATQLFSELQRQQLNSFSK